MLDRETVTRQVKTITDNSWKQDNGQSSTLNGVVEFIVREAILTVLATKFMTLEEAIKDLQDDLDDLKITISDELDKLDITVTNLETKDVKYGKDGGVPKPQRSTKASPKDRSNGSAEAR